MPTGTQAVSNFDVFLTRLHECHELSAYEAIERLVQAGEAVGLDTEALLRMLERGRTFEELFEAIESKMESLRTAA